MITKRNQYKGFTTQESINADKIVDYLDRFSFNVTKKTVIVLDNASVQRKSSSFSLIYAFFGWIYENLCKLTINNKKKHLYKYYCLFLQPK